MDRELNSNPSFHNPSRANIEAIAQLERDALHSRSRTERFSENTVKFIGSITFSIALGPVDGSMDVDKFKLDSWSEAF